MGEGQQWAQKPGNPIKPIKTFDPAHPQRVTIVLDRKIGPVAPKKDTPFIKHIRIRSALLSKFWGRPVYLARMCCCLGASMRIPTRITR